MSSPYELLAGLALLREKKRLSDDTGEKNLESWSALLVKIGDDECVVRQDDVDEIITLSKLTTVNGVAQWLIGLGYFRGQVLNVLDGKQLLQRNHKGKFNNAAARILVVRGDEEWFGLKIEELVGIRHVWSDSVDSVDASNESGWLGYIEQRIRIEKRMVPVLKLKHLVRDLEMANFPETTI